jgi:hypothetical protein
MNRKLTKKLALLIALTAIITGANAQITLLQDFKNRYSAPIGKFQSMDFREGGFSGIYPIANSNGKEFWVISDRGMNVDGASANPSGCKPTYDKIFGFPSYAPKIHRVRLTGDSIQILQTISVKRPNGNGATGVLNPTGFGSTANEVASTDTVLDCTNFSKKIAAKDIWGVDCEGIVVDKDGNFWICEENGPTIWKLDRNGVVKKRFTPYANLSGAQPEDVMIDSVFKYRKNNRGFEGISITPNGKIYAMIQSPLLYPTQTVGEGTRVHRMLEIDPATNATRVMVYLNDGIIGASGANQIRLRDWKIGDMAAINDSTFLIIEHTFRGTTDRKNIYTININGATNVNSGLYGGKTLEALVDSAGLAANGVKPVKKKLFIDLLANGWPAVLDKPESLSIINDSTITVGNDNDYGQVSVPQDGIAVATGNLSHILMYSLKGKNKISGFKAQATTLSQGVTGPSSSKTPYVEPALPGVKTTAIISANDSVGSYRMAGTPDGLGAYDNGNGTFTLLVNHEFGNTAGAVRAHGSKGAFVSKWIINKNDLKVQNGSDLIKNVNLWNGTGYTTYNAANPSASAAFSRFCSADLPAVSAFYNAATGLGTQERIFMNGEENGAEGRAFGHIATGAAAGTTYELPLLGKFSWENSVASPVANDKTVVVGTDDATPGQVYIYVGTKTKTGTDVDKAGLTNGKLYGVKVTGLLTEVSTSIPTAGTAFTLVDMSITPNMTGAALNTASDAAGVTSFLRPEDGAWDPSSPNDFYFATTNAITSPSRLWRLRFKDVTNPELGGTIEAVLDGTEGQKMLDNITIDNYGHILMVEDVGNNVHLGRVLQYTIATDVLKVVGQHDPTRFLTGGANYLTQDEEASGILDAQAILGDGMFLLVDQAHYALPGEIVEGGQLLTLYNPDSYAPARGAGPSTAQTPYVEPVAPGVLTKAILTANDSIGKYKMAGTPDGVGAWDNGNGTFTMLVNHEFGNTAGAVRAHGSKGAFVSKWVINKKDLTVQSGSDLIKNVNLWNGTGYTTYNAANPSASAAFSRFCSADLPAVSAFYNAATGLGTQERIFMNGEENGAEGRAFGHIATGAAAGTTYELPLLGKFSWENSVASPVANDKTVVVGTDDATPGQVYIYVGTKTKTGTDVDKAGLTNGKLYGVKVTGLLTEVSTSIPTAGTAFTLVDMSITPNMTGAALNTASDAAGVTSFLRPEDGAWDPSSPNDFYFATTNALTSPSRLWRLRFTDVTKPELGGTIEAVLDGTEGQKMLDNITIDNYGHILMVEDVGGNVHIGKVWQYTIATDAMKVIAQHDPNRFLSTGSDFLTQDEEASGILDVQGILGAGMFLLVDQAHYALPGEIVEGGQLLTLYNPDTYNSNPEISLQGNSIDIPSGTTATATTNNTDFGTLDIKTAQTKTFVIKNTGIGSLVITGVDFTGTNAAEFTVTGSPVFPMTIAPNGTQNITVQFMPVADGARTATLNVRSNDFDEKVYTFALKGQAIAPEINIQGNGINIINGDQTAGVSNQTDYGTVKTGAVKTSTFTIQNNGAGVLSVSGISITGSNASEFTLVSAPTFPLSIASNGSQAVTVQFAPLASGVRTATLNVNSNDLDEASYTFALQGNANSTGIAEVKNPNMVTVYPNPFDGFSDLKFTLQAASTVNVEVYNILGERVETVVNSTMDAGTYSYKFGESQSAGVYVVKITVNNQVYVTRIVKNK